MAKRLSRLFRRYEHGKAKMLPANSLAIRYLDQSKEEGALWDGAGVVSRAFASKFGISKSDARLELTVVGKQGQDKCHAIISEELDVDIMLPRDTKKEVALSGDLVFVGVNPVHNSDHMRLDIQSHINLHEVFTPDYLKAKMDEWVAVQLHAMKSNNADMLDDEEASEESYWLSEYRQRGFNPLWFAGVAKRMYQQIQQQLVSSDNNLRVPVPGGRYYIVANAVTRAAGYNIVVQPNQILLHKELGAIVSDSDYPAIAKVLGGADQDDALWVHEIYHKGEYKILAWRSPNQYGEYWMFDIHPNTRLPAWRKVENGSLTETRLLAPHYVEALPPRIDVQKINYLDMEYESTLSKGGEYSFARVNEVIQLALKNEGALGLCCNVLNVATAIGYTPKAQPRLEDVIDGTVKTGANLEKAKLWAQGGLKVLSKMAIPRCLHQKVNKFETLLVAEDHWLDAVFDHAMQWVKQIGAEMEAVLPMCVPPLEVLQAAQPNAAIGHEIKELYAKLHAEKASIEAIEAKLALFSDGHLLGALWTAYMVSKEPVANDGVCWLDQNAKRMMRLLRTIRRRNQAELTEVKRIKVENVWFNLYKASDPNAPSLPSEINKTNKAQIMAVWKERTTAISTKLCGVNVQVSKEGTREVVVSTRTGNLMGYINKAHEGILTQAEIVMTHANDGNLYLILR